MPQIKKFTLLASRPGMSLQAFNQHWLHVHGPLAARQPEFWKYTSRYVQNHVLRRINEPLECAYAGVVQTWQKPRPDMSRGFVDEPRYFEIVRPDEEKFLDVKACSIVFTEERLILDGPESPVKLLCFLREPLAPLPSELQGFRAHVRRHTENQVIRGMSRSLTAGVASRDWALCVELWFDSIEVATKATEEAKCPAWARPGSPLADASRLVYLVEEHDIGPSS